jgi:hypothetical protein
VVEASQQWICVRPATYENAEESVVLERWLKGVRGGGGELRNTTFALLDPTGKNALTRTGRSPQMVYGDVASFAAGLDTLAKKFEANGVAKTLPLVPNLRLGLNIAACDGIPLVAIIESKKRSWKKLFAHLVELSQSDALSGQAHYVVLKNSKELEVMEGYRPDQLIYVLKTDAFGVTGEVVATFKDTKTLSSVALEVEFSGARIEKDRSRQHVRQGRLEGITWESGKVD